ncbi:MAG: type II toxin-antitoxin system HicB family antitoxin [Gemmatimonadaceae bacterium]
MIRYPVLLEATGDGYWVHAPDVPGCVSFGASREEALANMREALEGHLGLMLEQGDALPPASAAAEMLEVSLPPGR